MKLINPTDSELNAAFAETVCGWLRIKGAVNVAFCVPETGAQGTPPDFANSVDAMLPFLKKCDFKIMSVLSEEGFPDGWQFEISTGAEYGDAAAQSDDFERGLCIAMVRAHGVEVEFHR